MKIDESPSYFVRCFTLKVSETTALLLGLFSSYQFININKNMIQGEVTMISNNNNVMVNMHKSQYMVLQIKNSLIEYLA